MSQDSLVPTKNWTVIHFGNKPEGDGGIASVIRSHLRRSSSHFKVSSIPTYDQDATFFFRKNIPFLSAVKQLLSLSNEVIIHIHLSQGGSLLREGLILAMAKSRKHPVIATIHGSSLASASKNTARLLRLVLQSADIVHGFSDVYRESLGLSESKWRFVPNDVDVPEQVTSQADRKGVVVYAGQVGYRKGIDLILDAWNQVDSDNWRLVVAGAVRKQDESLVFSQKWPAGAEYVGRLKHGELLNLLSTAKVLVQPSRAEAFPMSVCEALANGCAVIGTRVGGMGELLDSAGQRTVAASATSLATELQRLMRETDELQNQGERGYRYARNRLARTVITSDWARVYLETIEVSSHSRN